MDERSEYINLKDPATDEQTLHCMGAAVVANWERIPKETRERLMNSLGNVVSLNMRTPKNVKNKFRSILDFNELEE